MGLPHFPKYSVNIHRTGSFPKPLTSCQLLGKFPRIRSHFKVGTENASSLASQNFWGSTCEHVSVLMGGNIHIRTPIESAPTWTFQFGNFHWHSLDGAGKVPPAKSLEILEFSTLGWFSNPCQTDWWSFWSLMMRSGHNVSLGQKLWWFVVVWFLVG